MENRKMGPLDAEHPLVMDGSICPACKVPFTAGEYVTLVPIGPGADPEEQEKCRVGRPYNAVALPAHWACVSGEE